MNKAEFDQRVAQYYVQKKQSAASRGLEFTLTFTQVKNMLRAKRCQLTGVPLVDNCHSPWRVTIDRLDNKKGVCDWQRSCRGMVCKSGQERV